MTLPSLSTIMHSFISAASGLPPDAPWMIPVVLFILGAAAVVDAKSARVPDPVILLGVFLVLLVDGLYVDWPFAATRLAFGFGAAILLSGVNLLWFRFFHHDAIGMGDAKWTALAIMAFATTPVVIAWFLAAWLGVLWLGAAGLMGRKIAYVHFVPFLFVGLLLGAGFPQGFFPHLFQKLF